ncbi:hypothetical protein PU560_12075 [Georgenia sp. 10Sc9-8]|uniref:KAP NTPase domain-containing protein n=1 Tax=Georgenia halotolerans TaxID=3028317 RepID=A0ABT5TYR2_9MICO|nr:hypothetical protein [Georgenia halotolerans]
MIMLIGRDDLIDAMLTPRERAPAVADIRGELGTGRTSVLRRLQAGFDGQVPVFDLERYDPGHNGQAGANVSVGAAEASYARWVELLSDIAGAMLGVDDLAAIQAAGREGRTHMTEGRTSCLLTSIAELDAPIAPEDHVQAVRAAAAELSREFCEHWGIRQDVGPLLLDNVDVVMDQELGRWLMRLLDEVAKDDRDDTSTVSVVLARTPDHCGGGDAEESETGGGDASGTSGRRFEVHELAPLTAPQVGAFVKEFRGGWPADDIATERRLHEITSGHPATLWLVCDLLYGDAAPGAGEVERMVRDLPARGRQQAALLVEQVLKRSGRRDVLHAVQVAAVPRKFDSTLLRRLMEADGHLVGDVQGLFDDDLPRQSFVERLDEEGEVLRLHEHVRRSVLARLQSTDEERLTRLSGIAASHYGALLRKKHRDGRGQLWAYGTSYLYESPAWQAKIREWLYHSGSLANPGEQREFLLQAARLFLDGFYWWGYYVHFEFCDQLVADLRQLVRQRERPVGSSASTVASLDVRDWPELGRLHAAFVDILAHYPPRSVKTEAADWDRVRNALFTVQQVCGLAGRRRRQLSELQRHVLALLQLLLAHTWRYSSWEDAPQLPQLADRAYEEASRFFGGIPEDEWLLAWVHFERAELTLDRVVSRSTATEEPQLTDVGIADVWALWTSAAEIVQSTAEDEGSQLTGTDVDDATDVSQPSDDDELDEGESDDDEFDDDEPDHELMSHLHRMRADLLAMDGDIEAAAESYGRSVFHAFLFHLVGGAPDEYTMQFYVDVQARAVRFVSRLWSSGERRDAVNAARLAWPAAYAHHRGIERSDDEALERLIERASNETPDPLAEALWPKGPQASELGSYEGPCAKAVNALNMELRYDASHLTDLRA